MAFRIALQSFAVAAALLLAPLAQAQGGVIDMEGMSDQEAKSHFKVAKSLYEAGRFAEAAREFERAYQLSQKPDLLYNVYVAYRDATDLPNATDALRRFLAVAQIEPDVRVNLEARLRAMEEADARSAAPATTAPQSPPAAQPPASPPEPAPAVQPAPPEASAGTAELSLDSHASIAPYVLMGLGGAALVAGAITAGVAAGQIGDIEDSCPDDLCPAEFDLDHERDNASSLRTVAFALLGGGVVLGAGGLTWLLLDAGGAREERTPSAAVRCGASGCVGSVSGRF